MGGTSASPVSYTNRGCLWAAFTFVRVLDDSISCLEIQNPVRNKLPLPH